MKIKWIKIPEGKGDDLPRGPYLVSNGNTVGIFWHFNLGKDLCNKIKRTHGKAAIDWTHYCHIENIPLKKLIKNK